MANPFTLFKFPATGTSTLRSMPDRLAEIKNVKDWGAIGDGSTSDTAAIQAAIDAGSAGLYGTIYFPAGEYKITSPGIKFNYAGAGSIRFLGEGRASLVTGNFAGFLLERSITPSLGPVFGPVVLENMVFTQSSASGGAVRIGSSKNVSVRDCAFNGADLLWLCDADYTASEPCVVENSSFIAAGVYKASSFGIVSGGATLISACDATGMETAICAYGYGTGIHSSRFETNMTLISVGKQPNGTIVASGNFYWFAGSTESNYIGLDMYNCDGFLVAASGSTQGACNWGRTVVPGPISITSDTGETGTINASGIDVQGNCTIGSCVPSNAFIVGAGGRKSISGAGIPAGAKISSFPVGGGNGVYRLGQDPLVYLRIAADTVKNGVFAGTSWGQVATTYAVDLPASTTTKTNLVFIGTHAAYESALANNAGLGWRVPTTAHTATFINCDTQDGGTTVTGPVAVYTFANLPTGANVKEGDEYDISNAHTSTGAWGETVSGSGGTTVGSARVRFDGSVWRLMGK